MPRFEIELSPVDHVTADAIGPKGQRVFYLIHCWPKPTGVLLGKQHGNIHETRGLDHVIRTGNRIVGGIAPWRVGRIIGLEVLD